MTLGGSTLLAFGHYVPHRVVSNADIEQRLGLEHGWIERRTGIQERRYAADDEALSDIAVAAAEQALARIGLDRARIGLVVLATSTPDHLLPPSAPLVAHRLGLESAGAIDMAGACSGFLHALTYADAYVRLQRKPALVIAANILSRRTNPNDRASVILFGDAAAAAVLAPDARTRAGLQAAEFASDGAAYDLIRIPAGGSRFPFARATSANETLMQIRDGRAVFAKAVDMMVATSEAVLKCAGLTIADIRYLVPHQANSRIMSAVQRRLGVASERVLTSVAKFANSSAATIPLTLSVHAEHIDLKPGDRLLMCAAGAGLTGGALIYEM